MRLHLVETLDDACAFMRWLGESREILAVDTETTGLNRRRDRVKLCQFGDADAGWSIPWQGWGGVARQALEAYEGETTYFNMPFDVGFLDAAGVDVRGLRSRAHDVSVMAHNLDSTRIGNRRRLKPLMTEFVDRDAAAGQEILDHAMTAQGWTWETVPIDFPGYWAYGALDTVGTARLHSIMYPQVRARCNAVYEMDIAVAHIIDAMKHRGVPVDEAYIREKGAALAEYEERMLTYIGERWPVFRKTVKGATVVSIGNDALAQVLLNDGAPMTERTKTGKLSVAAEVLEGLAPFFELAECVLSLRSASKIRSTYFDSMLFNLEDGRVYPGINPLGTRTGRMSSSGPNFQNVPSRSGPLVRDAIRAEEGKRLLTVDYDQIQLRVLAALAGERTMLEAIRSGEDLHWINARMLYGPGAEARHRSLAKGGAYAKIFGAGPAKLAAQQGIPLAEAQSFMQNFDAKFVDVAQFQRAVERAVIERQAQGRGYVDTFTGRRLLTDRGKEYTGLNYICQGGEADVVKLRLIEADKAGLSEYMLLPVHDEVVSEVPVGEAEAILREMEKVLTDPDSFSVPMTASGKIVERWGDAYHKKDCRCAKCLKTPDA